GMHARHASHRLRAGRLPQVRVRVAPGRRGVRPRDRLSGAAGQWRSRGLRRPGTVLRDRVAGRTRGDARAPRPERTRDTRSYARRYLDEAARVGAGLDAAALERVAVLLADLRARGGRLFFLGVGGSAANCSHAVNDFRKIAGIEAYTPVDNVSELTARTNDEGWETVFVTWLEGSRLTPKDMIFIFSGGGGSLERNDSPN